MVFFLISKDYIENVQVQICSCNKTINVCIYCYSCQSANENTCTNFIKANQQGKRHRNRVITISKCKFNQYETNTDVFLAIIKTTLQDFFNSRV